MSALVATVCLLALATPPHQSASGSGAVIVVVAPPGADPAVSAALNRFTGEAASVGFYVTVVVASRAASTISETEAVAKAATAVVTFAFVDGVDSHAFAISFTDRLTGKTVVGYVSAENEPADRASVVLAVKAVEFLRARMFDFLVARPTSFPARQVQAASPATLKSTVDAVPESPPGGVRERRVALSLGVAALQSLEGLGTMLLPVLGLRYNMTDWSSLRITLGGGGRRSRISPIEAAGTSATIAEDVATGQWVVMLRGRRVRPALSLGAGVHRLRVEGMAVAPDAPEAASRIYLATSASVGLFVSVTQRLAIAADVGPFLLFPEPQVLVAGIEAGRTGRPGVSASVAMEARF